MLFRSLAFLLEVSKPVEYVVDVESSNFFFVYLFTFHYTRAYYHLYANTTT